MTEEASVERRVESSPDGPARPASPSLARFLVLFVVTYAALYWLFNGSGPIPLLNKAVQDLTDFQAVVAQRLLRLIGETVDWTGGALVGPGFSCTVEQGCNGLSALILVLAGILAFPAGWRQRLAGLALLIPGVLIVNLIRIFGLYWTGARFSGWFKVGHMYVGQVFVIAVTVLLWWIWLSWISRPRSASS